MSSSLKLYSYFRSSTSYRARIGLNLKQANYEYFPVNLMGAGDGEQYSEEYKKINPNSGVPSLIHNGKVISQSLAILEYLDETFPNICPFFPKDSYQRAKVRQISEIINADTHPLQNVRVSKYLVKHFNASEEQKANFTRHWITLGLNGLEKVLSETSGRYCVGDQLSMADIVLVPQLFSARRFGVDLGAYPLMLKIEEQCLKWPEIQKAHPFLQVDCPEELKQNK